MDLEPKWLRHHILHLLVVAALPSRHLTLAAGPCVSLHKQHLFIHCKSETHVVIHGKGRRCAASADEACGGEDDDEALCACVPPPCPRAATASMIDRMHAREGWLCRGYEKATTSAIMRRAALTTAEVG